MSDNRIDLKWDDTNYLKAYQLARAGNKDRQIATALGVHVNTYNGWLKTKPAFRKAVTEGREDGGQTFLEYVHGLLPTRLRTAWAEIVELDKTESGQEMVQDVLRDHGVRARQHLFLHALVHCNFNRSSACKMLGIKAKNVERWLENDSRFQDLMREIFQAKKDLFEESLVKLVKAGETAAVLFANRTLNRDRGYGNKVEVEVRGGVEHSVKQVSVEDLGLSIEERKRMLKRLRERREATALPAHHDAEDAEYTVRKD